MRIYCKPSRVPLLLFVVFTALIGSVPSFGQLQKLILKSPGSGPISPQSVEIPDGEFLELVSTSVYNTTATYRVDGLRVFPTTTFQVPGPATFGVSIADTTPPADCFVLVTYRIRDNASSDAPTTPFSGSAVVIPEDASGPVEIILESSTDLVNWTVANPGTYGSSTARRFFRVRAVIQSGNPDQ